MTFSLKRTLTLLATAAMLSTAASYSAIQTPVITPAGMKSDGKNGVPAAGTILPDSSGRLLTPTQINDNNAWVLNSPDGSYFKAADGFRDIAPSSPHPAIVIVMFKDNGIGEYHFSYDSNDPQTFKPDQKPGAWKPLPPLKTTASGDWKMAEWYIKDARFAGNLKGADLYLEGGQNPPLTIRGIYFQTDYGIAPDLLQQPGVPKGDLIDFTLKPSKIFPGAIHAIRVYVPRQYDGAHPACVWVSQDGGVPSTLLDNLIAKKDVPVIISIGVKSGEVPYPGGKDAKGKPVPDVLYRTLEYACVNDDYVRFLTDEVYPEVEKLKTPDGRAIHLSHDGKDAGIDGGSAGGICAFVAAWVRPDAFSRAYSAFGGLDGFLGNIPHLVRVMEPRPIRVFLQDGSHDLNFFAGDLWMANQSLDRALDFAGYDHDHAWGDGGHDGVQSQAIFPDVMRYLWKDWPAPIRVSKMPATVNGLIPGEDWKTVWEGRAPPTCLASNSNGEVFFNEFPGGRCYKIDPDGNVVPFAEKADGDGDAVCGSDGRLYQVDSVKGQVTAYDKDGKVTVITDGIKGCGIAALSNGRFYVSEPGRNGQPSHIWLIAADGTKQIVDTEEGYTPGSLAIDPSETSLAVRAVGSLWGYSYQIEPDGTLKYGARHFPLLESEPFDPRENAGGLICDRDNIHFFATHLGIQLNDVLTKGIIAAPPAGGVQRMALGGQNLMTFFITSGNKICARKTHYRGKPTP